MQFSTFCEYVRFSLKDKMFNNYYMKVKYVNF